MRDEHLQASHNRVEREFAREDLGGERTASILTIVATCVSYGVNPRTYLYLVTESVAVPVEEGAPTPANSRARTSMLPDGGTSRPPSHALDDRAAAL